MSEKDFIRESQETLARLGDACNYFDEKLIHEEVALHCKIMQCVVALRMIASGEYDGEDLARIMAQGALKDIGDEVEYREMVR